MNAPPAPSKPPSSRGLIIARALKSLLCHALWQLPCRIIKQLSHMINWMSQRRTLHYEQRLNMQVQQHTALLQKREQRYRVIFDQILDGLIILDQDDRIDSCNAAAARIFDYRLEELYGQPLSLLLTIDYAEIFTQLRQRQYRVGFNGETQGRRRGNRLFPIEISVGIIEIAGGQGFSLLVRDISERRHGEQAQERLIAILDNSPDLVMTFSLDGQLLFLNRVGRRLYGLEQAPLAYRSVRDLIPTHKLDHLLNHAVPIAFLKGLWEGEGEMPSLTGEYRQAAWQLVRHQAMAVDDQYYSLLMRDITDHKRRERDLIAARHAAEIAARAKSAFLASMSHEIRTPMNGILGMAELLCASPLNTEQREFAETLLQSGRSLLALLNDILDFSKIEAGKLRLDPISFDLERLICDVLQIITPSAARKSLPLIVDYAADCPRHFIGDAGRLRQVLLNLVGNAVKFTEQGHVRIRVQGTSLIGQRVALYLSVEDTGMGIEPEAQQRLFQAFSQADDSITRRHGGSGLGLAIAQQLIALMEGDIRLRSEPGQGTCFDLAMTLPLALELPVSRETPLPSISGYYQGRVLLAEDVATNRTVATALLRHLGLMVETVENGQIALERCMMARYDLVFMDCQMPVLDGLAATREIRRLEANEQRPRQPIIALTANAFAEDREQCRTAGMDDFLAKPLQLAALEALIQRWLGMPKTNAKPCRLAANLSATPLLDRQRLEHLRELMGEDFSELIPAFKDSVRGLLATVQQAISEDNRPELKRCMHAIKSASANLGALLLSRLAQEMETASEQATAEQLATGFQCLETTFQKVCQALAQTH